MIFTIISKCVETHINNHEVYIEMGEPKGEKKTTSELLKLIIKSVSEGEKSILEIANDIESNWETVKTYLVALTDAGILSEEDKGNKRVFIFKNNRNNKTYFNLPLTSEQEKLAKGLFFRINEKWNQLRNTPITQLQAQKILVKIIKSHNLNIPVGRYIYGEISICSYCNTDLENFPIGQDIITELDTITEEVAKDKFAYETKQKHYLDLNETYQNKEQILGILYSKTFDKNDVPKIQKLFLKIHINENQIIVDNEVQDILQAYSDLLFDINTCYDKELFEDNKRAFIQLFEKVWKLIAMFIFKNDLGKYYSQNTLDVKFVYDIEQTKREILDLARELQSQVIEEEPTDKEYLELKELQRKYSNEPRKDLSKTNRKDLFNEIGL